MFLLKSIEKSQKEGHKYDISFTTPPTQNPSGPIVQLRGENTGYGELVSTIFQFLSEL